MTAPQPRDSSDGRPPGGSPRPVKELRFAVVGAYVLDCFVETPRMPGWGEEYEARSVRTSPGGKAFNQAIALARLGGQVAAVGVVGEDGPGRDIQSALIREGVTTTGVEVRPDVSSAVCVCFVGDDGDSSIVWHIDDDVAVTPATVGNAARLITGADAVLITYEMSHGSVSAAIETTRDSEAMVIVQPAPPFPDAVANHALPWDLVDVLVANEAEAWSLLDDHADDRHPLTADLAKAVAVKVGVSTVVVTLGKDGCVLHHDQVSHHHPAYATHAVDATGAGDAFVASFAAGLAAGSPMTETIQLAQSAASWAVRNRGGYAAMPGSDQLATPSARRASSS